MPPTAIRLWALSHAPRLPAPALLVMQPFLARIIREAAARHPDLIARLGPHRRTRYLIDPIDIPFVLLLAPNPERLVFTAHSRATPPDHDARIAAPFLDLVRLVDCGEDGDALFFSRALDISGDTEAVVTLRNAIDDVDGSIAATAAGTFGPPGRLVLAGLRHLAARRTEPRR